MAIRSLSSVAFVSLALLVILTGKSSSAELCKDFYSKSCPKLFRTVKSVVKSAVSKERRMGASLVRLFFHDCFVNGCDGSILLDDTPCFRGEQTAGPNNNSVRGYNVIDQIKSKVEHVCPGVVSCADIVAIAARDSTVLLGGPNWNVKLGRRDAKTASFYDANNTGVLPSPRANLSTLIKLFGDKGLSPKDMVALSGAHTIGQARCVVFRDRIYNRTNIDSSFAKTRQANCPRTTGSGDNKLAPLDVKTANFFDNAYYKNLIHKKGLLNSDQVLFNGGSTDSFVRTYSSNPDAFYSDFVSAMIKMGDLDPLTGCKGEIRKKCSRVN
ncbi:hypothetical protein K2173_016824 [Erythroxylum novogranatense]|uniref:Peroxidase n=1 Tax=Erythroxylum novogranatense TaxID=1862640 RepID=A0AAV8SHV8_9ROSI|nr:hypothetical protein K2173_016824 [Erythroxylum novogranatense]